jgi:hypothetical protein
MPEALQKPGSVREYATAVTRWAIDLEERLSACNADKRALREWCEAVRQGAIQHD